MKFVVTLLLALPLFTLPVGAAAASEGTGTMCAQLYPCDEYGNLRPEFLDPERPCYEFYRSQCTIVPPPAPEGSRCEPANGEVQRLRKELRKLKLRIARRS